MDTETFERLGLHRKLPNSTVVNGKSAMDILQQLSHPGDAPYRPCPEASPGPDVPSGRVEHIADWRGTAVFPHTARDIAVYLPAQLELERHTPNVLVFNDGRYYLDPAGSVRATRVLDSLIHQRAIPITIAIFVQSGRPLASSAVEVAAMDHEPWDQASYEFDRLTDHYPRMIAREIFALVEARFGLRLTDSPGGTAICGVSSGGIAAFNAAWQMPGRFGCVISHCGSFTNIHGGHNYPYLVRMTERKPIRVWMQSGEHDADAPWGNWPLANKVMADALAYAGYDAKFVFGTGGHNLRHGGSLFADTVRWLWGDHPGR